MDDVTYAGADCSCGHPAVWRSGRRMCAVYGSHITVSPPGVIHRNRSAPLAWLVDLLDSCTRSASVESPS